MKAGQENIGYELALFAGAGGGLLGGMLAGLQCIGAVEIEDYPRKVLFARMRDGILDEFPIWDDVCTFRSDNPECAGFIGELKSKQERLVISGGFPCQDLSSAKFNPLGLDGERSGLWSEQARIIGEIRPAIALVENSSMLVVRGIGRVLASMVALGYDCAWGVFTADMSGGFHKRPRVFILGNSAEKHGYRLLREIYGSTNTQKQFWRPAKSEQLSNAKGVRMFPGCDISRMADGMAFELDRIAAVGNGQDAGVVKMAYGILSEILLRKYGEI